MKSIVSSLILCLICVASTSATMHPSIRAGFNADTFSSAVSAQSKGLDVKKEFLERLLSVQASKSSTSKFITAVKAQDEKLDILGEFRKKLLQKQTSKDVVVKSCDEPMVLNPIKEASLGSSEPERITYSPEWREGIAGMPSEASSVSTETVSIIYPSDQEEESSERHSESLALSGPESTTFSPKLEGVAEMPFVLSSNSSDPVSVTSPFEQKDDAGENSSETPLVPSGPANVPLPPRRKEITKIPSAQQEAATVGPPSERIPPLTSHSSRETRPLPFLQGPPSSYLTPRVSPPVVWIAKSRFTFPRSETLQAFIKDWPKIRDIAFWALNPRAPLGSLTQGEEEERTYYYGIYWLGIWLDFLGPRELSGRLTGRSFGVCIQVAKSWGHPPGY